MRCLVTGGTGFIGSHLTRKLLSLGHSVSVTGREKIPDGATVGGAEFDACFHLAADNDTLSRDAGAMFRANLIEPTALFKKLLTAGCRTFVYASSFAVYGPSPSPQKENSPKMPLNPYAESKLAFEAFCSQFPADAVIGLRYSNVYGPGEAHKGRRASMVHQIYTKISSGETPKLFFPGTQRRDWVYVGDVVDMNLWALGQKGRAVYNCGSGTAATFNDVVAAVNAALGTDAVPEYIPCPFPERFQSDTLADMSKAKSHGFVPKYSLSEGVQKIKAGG